MSHGGELTPASGSFITDRVRASPSSGTLRHRVARLTPRTWATSVTGVFSPIIFRACFNFAGLNRALSASCCNAAVCSAVDTLA